VVDDRGRWWCWGWWGWTSTAAATGHGMNARDSESNEGEDAGELHFERLLGSLESDWNGCLIVLLIVVLECLLLVLRTGGCPPFIDKIDETIWPPATDCLVLFLRSQKLSNITNCFSRGLLIQLLSGTTIDVMQ